MRLSWSQALAWRMRQQLLDPVGTESVAGMVGRLGAMPANPAAAAELGAAVTDRPKFRHLGFAFADRAETLLKPLAWQGDMSFGPPRDGHATYQRLDRNPRWAGVPDLNEAGTRSRRTSGRTGQQHLTTCATGSARGWAYAASGSSPGSQASATAWRRSTSTGSPPARRKLVSRQANLVIVGGVVSGTWSLTDDQVVAAWFTEAVPPARDALAEEVGRLATILDRPLGVTVQMA